MSKKNNNSLFNRIAPFYGLYFEGQKKRYAEVIDGVKKELDVTAYQNIIDVGCGTGALCSVLDQKGLVVTGVDPAQKMLEVARRKSSNRNVTFIQASVLERLPFEDKHFDLSIASYVAHGLQADERKRMYAEMVRVTKHRVVIYDYNKSRSLFTNLAEWLEGGDYFHFIQDAESELKSCVFTNRGRFSEVKVVNVDVRAAWYICSLA